MGSDMIVAFDLETTGPEPTEARIVTYSLVDFDSNGVPGAAHHGLVDPGVEIPEEATAVHGISTEMARADGEPMAAAVRRISDAVRSAGAACAFNARYDLTVLAHELRRLGEPYDWLGDVIVLDPLVMDRRFDTYRKGRRTLRAVCGFYGIALENTHSADADALAAGLLYFRIRERHRGAQVKDLGTLHVAQRAWAREQALSLQSHFRRSDPEAVVETRWPYYID